MSPPRLEGWLRFRLHSLAQSVSGKAGGHRAVAVFGHRKLEDALDQDTAFQTSLINSE